MLKLRVANYELNLELSKIFAESSFETVSCSSFLWVELLNSMSLKRVTENQISSSKIFHSQTFLLFSESFLKMKYLTRGKMNSLMQLMIYIHYYFARMITLNTQTASQRLTFNSSLLFYVFFFYLIVFFLIISFQTIMYKETSRLLSISHIAYTSRAFAMWCIT